MWKYILHSILFILICVRPNAQGLLFDFENLNSQGWSSSNIFEWNVDTLSPISGKGSLHHNYDNSEAGEAYIQYSHDQLIWNSQGTDWSFQIKYGPNPSSSNNWAVLLMENSFVELNPGRNGNAFVLGVNYIGSDDLLTLWKQEGITIEPIIKTTFNWEHEISKDKGAAISINRSRFGKWEIFIDTSLHKEWTLLGGGIDTSFDKCSSFGIYYKYTSSNDRLLWLDDIQIAGTFMKDTLPPGIDTFKVENPKQILLFFDEPVDTMQAFYCRLNREDILLKYNWLSCSDLRLEFARDFKAENLLEIYSISDYHSNAAQILQLKFDYYLPQQYDLLLTEILPDPFPSVGLPEAEYVELFNRSEYVIDIKDWKMIIGDYVVKLPSYQIGSGDYLVLSDFDDAPLFDSHIPVLGVINFPSLPNNSGSVLLESKAGKNIHSLKYEKGFYLSNTKKEGGWSLELVDVGSPCLIEQNWKESEHLTGGTPGMLNSVVGLVRDNDSPWIERISVTSPDKLEIFFSEPMDSLSISLKKNYSFTETKDFTVIVADAFDTKVDLSFVQPFEEYKMYGLEVKQNIVDCSGNLLEGDMYFFGMPQSADSADLLITEILFEASDSIPEFLEIYNHSDKIIDLRNLRLAFYDEISSLPSDDISISTDYLQLLPNEYLTITEDKKKLRKYYKLNFTDKVYEPASWRNLSNSGSVIAILTAGNKIIDKVKYNESMHSPLLIKTEGVSLERINPGGSGMSGNNWHSASSLSGYASPSARNSQQLSGIPSDHVFAVNRKKISPNNDGFEDFVEISCRLSKTGYYLTTHIFNSEGLYVTSLTSNDLAGGENVLIWDGTDNSGGLVPMGYYIIFMEAVNLDGQKLQKKETIAVLP